MEQQEGIRFEIASILQFRLICFLTPVFPGSSNEGLCGIATDLSNMLP